MGGKRKKSDLEEEEYNDSKEKKTKKEILPSMIKNKDKRSEVHAKLKHQKKLEKRKKIKARDAAIKRALDLGEEVPIFFFFLNYYYYYFWLMGFGANSFFILFY